MKRKIILLLVGAVGAFAAWYAYSEFTRKPATANELTTDFVYSADAFVQSFTENEETATKKHLNKVIEVTGTIAEISANEKFYSISLSSEDPMTSITVQLIPEENEKAKKLKEAEQVTIKGICNGKLADIELNKGIIVK